MKISKKIFYNISESDEILKVGEYKLYFSSFINKIRFRENYKEFIKIETQKLKIKNHININIVNYLIIVYYLKIEKRGFYIYFKDKLITNKDELNFELIIK